MKDQTPGEEEGGAEAVTPSCLFNALTATRAAGPLLAADETRRAPNLSSGMEIKFLTSEFTS